MLDLATIAVAAGAAWTVCLAVYMVRTAVLAGPFPVLNSHSHADGRAAGRVSIVVAAKDEESSIERCVRSLLTQDYPDLELIVVNDRSSDRTGEILAGLVGEYSQLRVVTIEQLPEGWGGQNHAVHRGSEVATGQWLCLTDADCVFDSPRTVSVAVAEATHHHCGLLTVTPRLEARGVWEHMYLPLCSFVYLMRMRLLHVNNPKRVEAAYANGAFMLFRTETYHELGGHERVRGYVQDDVRLARIAKREGVAVRVVGNDDLVRVAMYDSLKHAWSGWTRNTQGSSRDGVSLLWIVSALSLILVPLPVLGTALLFEVPVVVGAWAAPVVVLHLGAAALYRSFRFSWGWSLFFYPATCFVWLLNLAALLRTAARQSTRWHGAHYTSPDAK